MAALNFEHYFFESFSFRENVIFDGRVEKLNVSFFPHVDITILEKLDTAIVTMKSRIGNEKETACPFLAEVTLTGIFKVSFDKNDDRDKAMADSLITQNTIAILFPYLRSFISDMTLRTNKYPAFILPPFNIVEMLEENASVTVHRVTGE